MAREPTHASFFSGVGGLDLGLERAGWRTVSLSEIDPYASAVLAERWPGVPNLGSITDVADGWRLRQLGEPTDRVERGAPSDDLVLVGRDEAWCAAALWTGGFPCQDLSVAGKRRGMVEGTRSNLAYAFLALVERHRPPAVLLENVPGLLSSHRGRDMAALLGRLAELGYGVAYRVLDARHFGVPQRRRRVFILGLRSESDDPSGRVAAERAATVLAVGSRCPRHPATGGEAGADAAGRPQPGVDIARAVTGTSGKRHDDDTDTLIAQAIRGNPYADHDGDDRKLVIGPPPDPGGVRAADGLAGRLDDRELAATLNSGGNDGGFRTEPGEYLVATLRVGGRSDGAGSSYDNTPWTTEGGSVSADDPLLPLGLDSHRYRCCGNGVVANVAEWLGRRLIADLAA